MELWLFVSLITSSELIVTISGTGVMYDPPSRAVMWKYQFPVKKNYNYMQLHCGGTLQQEFGEKKCGVCGDKPDGPRDHEAGGAYGSTIISRYYPSGTKEIKIKVEVITYKKGWMEFRMCKVKKKQRVTQKCLDDTQLPIKEGFLAGTPLRYYPKSAGDFHLTVAIPPKLVCKRCVLQWRYRTGVSWGYDPVSGTEGMGKGLQEEFYNCADIRIGGRIPRSVKQNIYFAPPDPKSEIVSVDKPTLRRKALAEERAALSGSEQKPGNETLVQEALSAIQQQLELGIKVTKAEGQVDTTQLGLSAGSVTLDKGMAAVKTDRAGTKAANIDMQKGLKHASIDIDGIGIQLGSRQTETKSQQTDSIGNMDLLTVDGSSANLGTDISQIPANVPGSMHLDGTQHIHGHGDVGFLMSDGSITKVGTDLPHMGADVASSLPLDGTQHAHSHENVGLIASDGSSTKVITDMSQIGANIASSLPLDGTQHEHRHENIGLLAVDGITKKLGTDISQTGADVESSMHSEGIQHVQSHGNVGLFATDGSSTNVGKDMSQIGAGVSNAILYEGKEHGHRDLPAIDGSAAHAGSDIFLPGTDTGSSVVLEGIEKGPLHSVVSADTSQVAVADHVHMPVSATHLHPESGIIKAVGVDISSALSPDQIGTGLHQGAVMDTSVGALETLSSQTKSGKLLSELSKQEAGTGINFGSSSGQRDRFPPETLQIDQTDSSSLFPEVAPSISSDTIVPSTDTVMPVEGIAAFSSGQQIPIDMQTLKNADMSGIFSKLDTIADQGQVRIDSSLLSGQSTVSKASVGGTKKIVSETSLGKGTAADSAVRVGGMTPLALEPIEPTQHNFQEAVAPGATFDMKIDLGTTQVQSGNIIDQTNLASSGVLFTGKTIKAPDPATETFVEKGLNRAGISESISGINLNDMGLLSESQQLGSTGQMNLKAHDNKKLSKSPSSNLSGLKANQEVYAETLLPVGLDTVRNKMKMDTVERVGKHAHRKKASENVVMDSVDLQPLDFLPKANAINVNIVDKRKPKDVNTGQSKAEEESPEINRHNKTTKTEKTIQHVTTKNTSLPDGSNIVETKLKTVEVKVTETTKISTETNGAKKGPDTKNLVSTSELKPKDFAVSPETIHVQKASVIDKHKTEAANLKEVGAMGSNIGIKENQDLIATDQQLSDGSLSMAGETTITDTAAGGFDSVVQMALNDILKEPNPDTLTQTGMEAKSSEAVDIYDQSSVPGDTKSDIASSGLSVVKKGLSHLAKLSKAPATKKGKSGLNITSKKAKINISHDNTKRTVSEVDISKVKPEKTQPDVALIIVGSEGNDAAATLKGLAQSVDQVRQLEIPSGHTDIVPSKPAISERIDLGILADTNNQASDMTLKTGKQSVSKKILVADGGRKESTKRRGRTRASSTKARQGRRPRGKKSQSARQGRRQGKRKSQSSRRTTAGKAAVGSRDGIVVNQITETRRQLSSSSVPPIRATSFIDDNSVARGHGTQRDNRLRQVVDRPDTSVPMFSSGMTRGIRTGPESGSLTPEMRANFERRRLGMRGTGSMGRRLMGGSHRLGRRRLRGGRAGEGVRVGIDRRMIYPFDGLPGDERLIRRLPGRRFPIADPRSIGMLRAGRRVRGHRRPGYDLPGRVIDSRMVSTRRGIGAALMGRDSSFLDIGPDSGMPFVDSRSRSSDGLEGRGLRERLDGRLRPSLRLERIGIRETGAVRQMGSRSPSRGDRAGIQGLTAAATISAAETTNRGTEGRRTSSSEVRREARSGGRVRSGSRGLTGAAEVLARESGGNVAARRRIAASERRRLPGEGARSRERGPDSNRRRSGRRRNRMTGSSAARRRERVSSTNEFGRRRSLRDSERPDTDPSRRVRLSRFSGGDFVRPPYSTVLYSPLGVPYATRRSLIPAGSRFVMSPGSYMPRPMYLGASGPMYSLPSESRFLGSLSGFTYSPMGPLL